MGVNMLLQIFL